MGVAIRTWQIYVAVIFIGLIILFIMQDDAGPDALNSIWQIIKIVMGAIATTATVLWAFFSFQNNRLTSNNTDILNRVEKQLTEGLAAMRKEIEANSKGDREVRELLIKEIAQNKEFRKNQEDKWVEQQKINKEIFEKIEKISR